MRTLGLVVTTYSQDTTEKGSGGGKACLEDAHL